MIKTFFSGYMTRDPKVVHREVRDGRERLIVQFAIAHTDYWYDARGERREKTTFLDLTAFGSDAKYIEKYLRKGSYVSGMASVENNKYEKEGVSVSTYGFKVLEIEAPKLNRDTGAGDHPPHAASGRAGGIDDEIPF